MLNDSYGGICPNCGYERMLVRYGSEGYFQRDACPNCQFAYGNNGVDPEIKGQELWELEVSAMKETLRESKLPVSVLGILLYIDAKPHIDEIVSVFDYPDDFKWEEC